MTAGEPIPGSTTTQEPAVLTGTPEDWYHAQAAPLTLEEAAARPVGDWSIRPFHNGYLVSPVTKQSNATEAEVLRKRIVQAKRDELRQLQTEDPEERAAAEARIEARIRRAGSKVRTLLVLHHSPPAWTEENLLMADADSVPGEPLQRVLWTRRGDQRWVRVQREPRAEIVALNDHEMGLRRPAAVSISEISPAPAEEHSEPEAHSAWSDANLVMAYLQDPVEGHVQPQRMLWMRCEDQSWSHVERVIRTAGPISDFVLSDMTLTDAQMALREPAAADLDEITAYYE